MKASELLLLNPSNKPMTETHFYKWLEKNGDEKGNRLLNKRAYIESMNVEKPFDVDCDNFWKTINYIHDHFYYVNYIASGKRGLKP